MDLNSLHLPASDLPPGSDEHLARAVEAGVYAEHLLAAEGPDDDLSAVAAAGRHAQARMWSGGMRIAMQQARRLAAIHGLPADELFQDACVAVAEAIRRYDFRRGTRFTTFAFESVIRALDDGSRHRTGRPTATKWERRAARRVLREMEERRADGTGVDVATAAAAVGVSPAAAQRAFAQWVVLEEAVALDRDAEDSFARIAGHGLDFLDLLDSRDRRVLELRYGLGTEPHTLAAAAVVLGASPSTVLRWEREAIRTARALLTRDHTTTPPVTRSRRRARPRPLAPGLQ